ncbi:peptidylprolyl isomerase [Egicoccus halophilus]|uniref:Peptidyl-prolyl cis-trans isomerase n=1 Tax=Egicoccus halophilus TaxID=1670830 RepID=A0A8J3EWQ8_9ACTN|nr:peptidylprolyl isomerase [Egicoccus halophilus]GGI04188.1 peptidyl-prolyl cis-trans isomerase [Egicoccus halophilus]
MAKQWSSPPEMTIDPSTSYTATIRTSRGDITAKLYAEDAPATVNNFVFLAREGFYDGVIFHRVIEGFVIQGGDPTGTGTGGPGYKFADELDSARKHGYRMGTLAMANAGPDTNGSQFFVCHQDVGLPPSYTVFGKAVDGLDVVDAIATTQTDARDKPVEDVVISTIEITEG